MQEAGSHGGNQVGVTRVSLAVLPGQPRTGTVGLGLLLALGRHGLPLPRSPLSAPSNPAKMTEASSG